jgi:hypothetical protein
MTRPPVEPNPRGQPHHQAPATGVRAPGRLSVTPTTEESTVAKCRSRVRGLAVRPQGRGRWEGPPGSDVTTGPHQPVAAPTAGSAVTRAGSAAGWPNPRREDPRLRRPEKAPSLGQQQPTCMAHIGPPLHHLPDSQWGRPELRLEDLPPGGARAAAGSTPARRVPGLGILE